MDDHWLVRPNTIRWLRIICAVLLAGVVIADAFVAHHAFFGLDGTFGFGAWFGLLSCVGLVVLAKALGAVLKRPDTYYDR
jgi:hypothetical protein